MLDYLISLLDFTVGGTTYNLLTTPWEKMLAWIHQYEQYNPTQILKKTKKRMKTANEMIWI